MSRNLQQYKDKEKNIEPVIKDDAILRNGGHGKQERGLHASRSLWGGELGSPNTGGRPRPLHEGGEEYEERR